MQWADAVVGAFTEPVVVTDAALRVLACHATFVTLARAARPQPVGAPVHEVFPCFADAADGLRAALAANAPRVVDCRLSASGEDAETWLEARATPWRDRHGAVSGLVIFLTDVTARRRAAVFADALATVGQSLSSSLDLNEVLDTVAARTLEVMAGDAAMVVGWDGETSGYAVLRAVGRLSREYLAAGSIPAGGGPIARAVKEARPVTTRNILTDPTMWLTRERRREIEVEGFRAAAAAPLAAKGRIHGALVVHYWRERSFGDDEVVALSSLAAQAAIAIDNAALYGAATRRAERLRELADVEALLTGPLDLPDVLQRIAAATTRMLEVPLTQIWVANPDTRQFDCRATGTTVAIAAEALPTTLPAADALAGALATERASVLLPDVGDDARGASMRWALGFGLPALFAAPIGIGNEFLGLLTIHGRAGWEPDAEDRGLLVSVASRIGQAVRNAREYGEAVTRAARLGELVAMTRSISASLETSAVMQGIADAAAALSPGAYATVHVYDRDRHWLRALGVSGEDARRFPMERAADFGLPGLVTKERRPVVVRDPVNHPATRVPEWWRRHPRATYCGVPILVGDTFLGVLDFIVPDRPATAEEQELLQLLAAHAGIAMQNAALYESERKQGERVRALAEVNRRISSALDLDELLETIAQSAANLTGVRYASFWIADERRGTMTFSRGSDPVISAALPRPVINYGEGGVGWVAQHRQPLVVDELDTGSRIRTKEWWRTWGIHAWGAYPIVTGDELLAVLLLSDAQPLRFAPDTQGMIELFTAQAAVAIQNARLYAESDRERREAAALAAAARQLAASLDLDKLAPQLVEVLRELFAAHASALYRVREDGAIVSVAYGGAAREHLRAGEVLQSRSGVTSRVVQERRPVWTRDVLDDPAVFLPDEFRAAVTASGNRAVLGVPLIVKGDVIGVLAVSANVPRDFEPREIALLQAFADQAALALENARLYASARESLARLRDTQAQLVQAAKMSALGQLVSGVAHELNNPLSVVIGYGQLLLGRELPPAVKRPIELMVSQGDRMAKIVRSLLFFARQRPPERVPVKINQIIEETLALRQNQLNLSGIVVERQLADDLPNLPADGQQLQQVFLNLLLNAEQAILDAQRGGRILVRTASVDDGRAVRADVIDDGPGIPADVLPHVFEPFYTTKEVGAGTGLGLSVSYGIVQEHAGRLTVESRPGETTFTVELPVTEEAAAPRAVAKPPVRALPVHGRAALVVEDEVHVSDLIVTLLEESGWHVDLATGGRSGLERLRRGRYDLVVSDMRMPDGDGEELYRGATALDATLARRFIFLTGDTANPIAWRFLQETRAPVLEKPFSPAVFLEAVRRLTASLTPSTSSA